jgi:hypothetical protein
VLVNRAVGLNRVGRRRSVVPAGLYPDRAGTGLTHHRPRHRARSRLPRVIPDRKWGMAGHARRLRLLQKLGRGNGLRYTVTADTDANEVGENRMSARVAGSYVQVWSRGFRIKARCNVHLGS